MIPTTNIEEQLHTPSLLPQTNEMIPTTNIEEQLHTPSLLPQTNEMIPTTNRERATAHTLTAASN